MSVFDAFRLPGLDTGTTRDSLRAGDLELRYPRLDDAQVQALAASLRAARAAHLAERPVADVVAAIDRAARMFEKGGEMRAQAIELLPAVTRLSRPMIELVLDRMTPDWQRDALERLIGVELGGIDALDRFVAEPHAGRHVRALGPELTLNVFAGNVPGVAVSAIVRCLLVKSAVIGKSAADDPVLPVLFARALERVDPGIASCVAVTYWPGGSGSAEDAAIAEADAIVVYGGADAVASIRRRAPASARVLEHGPRMSLGFVGREALGASQARPLARAIARAAATFDQHGCVSLHGALVERGGETTPRDLARMVFEEMEALEAELPAGSLTPAEAAAIHAERGRAEFEHIEGGAVWASGRAGATVVYSERPDPTPSCLDRFVRIGAVDRLEDALGELAPLGGLLQSAGVAVEAGRRTPLAEALGRAGFTRVTSFDAMPWPPAHWHHDGAAPLRELIRWVDLEEDSAGARDDREG